MAERRFPPPWSIEDTGAAFVVKGGTGQKLGYFYYEEESGRRSAGRGAADCGQRGEAARAVAQISELEHADHRYPFRRLLYPQRSNCVAWISIS
jgi:hypothetical protein